MIGSCFRIGGNYYLGVANLQDGTSYNIDSKIYRWHIPQSDFDGDGKVDIFWRNSSTGVNALWLMDNDGILKKNRHAGQTDKYKLQDSGDR